MSIHDNPNAHTVRQADHDRADARADSAVLDRRVMDGDLRYHLMLEMDSVKDRLSKSEVRQEAVEKKVDQILVILTGSKFAIYIIIAIGSLVATMAAAFAWLHDKVIFK